MKKQFIKKSIALLFLFTVLFCSSCSKDDTEPSGSSSSTSCGTYNGKTLYKGPEGGCYYINSNGNKTYVDRSNCKCR